MTDAKEFADQVKNQITDIVKLMKTTTPENIAIYEERLARLNLLTDILNRNGVNWINKFKSMLNILDINSKDFTDPQMQKFIFELTGENSYWTTEKLKKLEKLLNWKKISLWELTHEHILKWVTEAWKERAAQIFKRRIWSKQQSNG